MSIWNIDNNRKENNKLNKDITVDTLIIGGGLTGMNLAYLLKDKKDICLVEGNIIGSGVTLRSTAKINYFQQCIYTDIINSSNYENAKSYLESQLLSINKLKEIIEKENIDCNFKKVKSYVFASSKDEVKRLEEEVKFLKEKNINVKKDHLKINIDNYLSYYVDDTYIFNPIKYLNGLYNIIKDKVNVYENTKIKDIKKIDNKYICYTLNNNKIMCNNVVFACHYPYFTFRFLMPLKGDIEKSYIIVSKVSNEKDYTCINTTFPVYSKRYYKDNDNIYQISLSKSNNLNKLKNDKYYFKRVQKIFNIKDKDIIMKYTNSDIMTGNYLPYIGKIKDNMYIALGFNTWGMTNSMLSSIIISDLLENRENRYEKVFNPNRIIFSKVPKYLVENTVSFCENKLIKNKKWYSDNVEFKNINGKELGIYTDKFNKKHIVYNKCPHLGCSLIFNEVEKTWDCPCHSSRFNLDGKCIKGPSLYDISYEE